MTIDDWKTYYMEFSQTSGHKKRINKAKEVITAFINDKKTYISWSAGKDSTALLFLIRSIRPDIKVMTIKDCFDYPGEIEYVKRIRDKYNINLDIIIPNVYFESLKNYDIFNDIHSRHSDLSIDIFYSEIKKYDHENKWTSAFLGLRVEESTNRLYNYCKRGFSYYNKKDKKHICCPIYLWKMDDVMAYLVSNNIEIFDIYWKIKFIENPGKIRKSWILPGSRASKGSLIWLKYYYPDLYNKIMFLNSGVKAYV